MSNGMNGFDGAAIERKISAIASQQAMEISFRSTMETRLTSIEENLKWLVRLVLGTLALSALTVYLNGGF